MLAQVGANAFGYHFNRHGIVPVQDDNTKYFAVAKHNNENGTNRLVELKTKHRSKRKSDTKAGFSWVKGYLPKQPDVNHVRQCAFYWYATKKTPHLLYVNQDSYNIFTPDTCELLTPEYMEFLVQQDLITAKIRQNLVYLCKGNPYEMAKLVPPPDFSGFMWKDIQDEYVRKAASLWDNV